MKVKVIAKDCLNHTGDAICCDFDFRNLVLEAVDDGTKNHPINVKLLNGNVCYFNKSEVEIVEED